MDYGAMIGSACYFESPLLLLAAFPVPCAQLAHISVYLIY